MKENPAGTRDHFLLADTAAAAAASASVQLVENKNGSKKGKEEKLSSLV